MIQLRRRRPEGDSSAKFRPGELVRHRRYGYRGVVVDFDLACQAPEEWYGSNQTQPRKDQPWYHVLVDGTHQTTYAAEENLALDDSPAPIHHPLLERYFTAFREGCYERNSCPWGE